MKYCVYLPSGQIVRSGECPEEMLLIQANNENETVIESDASWDTHYIENGLPVPIPAKPGDWYVFDYASKQWAFDNSSAMIAAKEKRSQFLLASDWTQIPNNPLTAEQQQAWAAYRQQLRDVPQQPGFPENIVWPVQPQE